MAHVHVEECGFGVIVLNVEGKYKMFRFHYKNNPYSAILCNSTIYTKYFWMYEWVRDNQGNIHFYEI